MNYKTTPLPKKVPIRGMWFRVKEVPKHEAHLMDCIGRCVCEEATIYVLQSLHPVQKWSTLFHEWGHALADGYEKLDICEDDNVAQLLADNLMPLVQYLSR